MICTTRIIIAIFFVSIAIMLSSCMSAPKRTDSMSVEDRFINRCMEEQSSGRTSASVIGGLTGAVAGSLVDRRKLGGGTILGGVIGAGVGYYIGRDGDLKECRIRWLISKNDTLRGHIRVMRDREKNLLRLVGYDKVTFDFGKAQIKPAFRNFLNEVGRIMRDDGQMYGTIIGHTDSIGSESYNQDLSERRAHAVAEILMQYTDKLNVYGRGESEPISDNNTPEGRAKNRRVEIELSLPED